MPSFWQTASSTPPCSWGNANSKGWYNMPPKLKWDPRFCALGRPLHTKRPATTLVETWPTKRLKIPEGPLFDIPSKNIFAIIDDWITRSKYKYKNKKIVLQFTCENFPVFCAIAYEHRKPHQNYGPLMFYCMDRYEWDRRLEKAFPIGLYMKPVFTKNKYEWLNMFKTIYLSHSLSYHHIFRVPMAANTLNLLSCHNRNHFLIYS